MATIGDENQRQQQQQQVVVVDHEQQQQQQQQRENEEEHEKSEEHLHSYTIIIGTETANDEETMKEQKAKNGGGREEVEQQQLKKEQQREQQQNPSSIKVVVVNGSAAAADGEGKASSMEEKSLMGSLETEGKPEGKSSLASSDEGTSLLALRTSLLPSCSSGVAQMDAEDKAGDDEDGDEIVHPAALEHEKKWPTASNALSSLMEEQCEEDKDDADEGNNVLPTLSHRPPTAEEEAEKNGGDDEELLLSSADGATCCWTNKYSRLPSSSMPTTTTTTVVMKKKDKEDGGRSSPVNSSCCSSSSPSSSSSSSSSSSLQSFSYATTVGNDNNGHLLLGQPELKQQQQQSNAVVVVADAVHAAPLAPLSSLPACVEGEGFGGDKKVAAPPPTQSFALSSAISAAPASSSAEEKNDGGDAMKSSSSPLVDNNNKSSSSSVKPKVRQWLQRLRGRAELETMSVLYAKSVPASKPSATLQLPTALAHQRVPLIRPMSSVAKIGGDVSTRCSMLALSNSATDHWGVAAAADHRSTSPPRMRFKPKEDKLLKHSDQQQQLQQQKHRHHHRSTVCLSSSTIAPSLVMSRQSIVMVPAAGEDGSDNDEMGGTFSKSGATDYGNSTNGGGGGTLTKFALSLPNDASLCERLLAQRPTTKWPASTSPHKPLPKTDFTQEQRVPPLMTTIDYTELPLCDPLPPSTTGGTIYQPRIKYRRNRKGGSSTPVNANGGGAGGSHTLPPPSQRRRSPFSIAPDSPPLRSGGGSALAVRPIAFRHSIRVNELDDELMSFGGNRNNFSSMPPVSSSMSTSLFCASTAAANKFNGGAGANAEDELACEEGSDSLDSGQCSGSSPPFLGPNYVPSLAGGSSALLPLGHHHHHAHQLLAPSLLQRYNNLLHNYNNSNNNYHYHHHHYTTNNRHHHYQQQQQHHHHQRCCSDEGTSSEAGTTSSSVELMMTGAAVSKFGASIERRSSAKMPSYARTANCIAQVLRLSSIIFAHLGSTASEFRHFNGTKKLLSNTKAYIRLLAECPCAAQMPQSEMELVRRAMQDAEGELLKYDNNAQPNDYLGVCVRRMLEQTLLVFVRLISNFLSECASHDQLLLIALEQFVHLLLFGDELCLEAIRHKAIDNLLALALVPLTGSDTLKLLLRTMSVLCGTAKGCIQLLSIGGLDLVLRVLLDSTHADCSTEAAGCLAQLCSPAHCFLRLSPHSLHPLVPRLLKLVDRSLSPEALLLCLAALANLCAQCAGPATELLYTHNAVLRLVKAAGREHSAGNLFVQEELVTIFTRMANRGFERVLVAQGAIPVLCRLLQLEVVEGSRSQRQCDFQRRVSYKAAVCLGILASTGSGLKALYENEVHKVLAKILFPCPSSAAAGNMPPTASTYGGTTMAPPSSHSMTATTAPPIQLICSSISQRLQHTYQLETAV